MANTHNICIVICKYRYNGLRVYSVYSILYSVHAMFSFE